jgi:Ricin-type beta-trefoil lectin domain-like
VYNSRRFRRFAAIGSVTAALLFASAGAAAAATTPLNQSTRPQAAVIAAQPIYTITSPGPNLVEETYDRVVDVANWSTADRGRVHMWVWRDGSDGQPVGNQRWTRVEVDNSGSGRFYLVNNYSGLCLDKSMDNGNVDGALVYQYGCRAGAANQEWYLDTGAVNGWFRFRSVADGRCLDIRDKVDANDATVQVWGCNSVGWNQAWSLF